MSRARKAPRAEPDALAFLSGGGDMGVRIRAYDWAGTSLGPPSGWAQALRTSLRVLLTTNHPIFVFWGPELICFYNDSYRQSLGAEKHPSILGARGREAWDEIWDIIGPQIEQVMAGRGATWHENQLVPITRHGRREDVYWTYSYGPIDDENAQNGVGGVLVICTETTRQVLAEQRAQFLLDLDRRLRKLTDPNAIMAVAAEALGRYLRVERCGYAVVDEDRNEFLVEQDWTDGQLPSYVGRYHLSDFSPLVIGRYREGHPAVIGDALVEAPEAYASRGVRAGIGAPLLKEGRLVATFFVQQQMPRQWNDGDVALVEDVADRTWSAFERARAEQALRDADRRKDEFLAMLAHELRNPLAPIRTAAQVLKLSTSADPHALRTSDIIVRQVEHMTEIVDDLLDVSRVTRGLVELTLEVVDVKQAIAAAVEQIRPALETRHQRLTLDAPPDLVQVRGDAVRLAQIVGNLLGNAVKYTQDGGVITLRLHADAVQVCIAVSDTGVGIAADLLPRIFDLFAQGDRTAARSQGGLGLGLALVKRLVELHGGAVEARSAGSGHGSEFIVRLPRAHAPTASPDHSGEAASHPQPGPLRLMVVDDNKDAADMLAMLLRIEGHEVSVEHDAHTALARAVSERPPVMLLDIGLPMMDGFELARRLRANPATSSSKLIALTGYGRDDDRLRSREAGFDHHLVKPVDPRELTSLLASLV